MTKPFEIGPHLLKRRVYHDERSRDFPAATAPVQPVTWPVYGNALNQGNLGSCTANALSQWLNAGPEHTGKLRTEREAKALYHEETIVQGGPVYPPNDPGGSGVAVCKAGKLLGLISGYNHAFGITHAKGAIAVSPFIVGSNWYQSMFTPDANGFVTIDDNEICPETGSPVAGGHEYLAYAYDPALEVWEFRNSWGKAWGLKGSFKMSTSTFSRLLSEQGDVTVPLPLKPAPAEPVAQKGSTMPIRLPQFTEATRAYIYRVLLAVLAVLAAVGKITGSDVALYTGLAGAVLGVGLAVGNTSTKK